MNKYFWKNKHVLVTGFEGFLGSNLTKRILSSGADVVGLDIKTGRDDTILDKYDYRRMKVIRGSVCNYNVITNILNRYNISIIFHLAAEAIVDECLKKPVRAFSSNIRGTWNLLEACRRSPAVTAIIVASSDKAYGNHNDLPYREDTPLRGKYPYDVSKSCADLIAHAYHNTYATPVAITRCGNIYGPGDYNFSRIVPESIRCALKRKTLFIRSNGKFIRDYVYVDDIVEGYITLAEKLQRLRLAGEAFNFSDGKPVSVIALVKKIYKLAGREEKYKILNRAKYEIPHQYLFSEKARKILHWHPKVGLKDGLNRTISWYRQVL